MTRLHVHAFRAHAALCTPHTHMTLPPRCSHTPRSHHSLACSLISGLLGDEVKRLATPLLCSYKRVRMDYIGVRGADGTDITGVSTDDQATHPCCQDRTLFRHPSPRRTPSNTLSWHCGKVSPLGLQPHQWVAGRCSVCEGRSSYERRRRRQGQRWCALSPSNFSPCCTHMPPMRLSQACGVVEMKSSSG
jgi:hypothetical protein